jgi:zinc protease
MRSILARSGLARCGLLCVLLSGGLYAPVSGAAPTLVSEQAATPGSLSIPYQMYRLPNGLTLILHPDHSDPLVHVNVTYHVGSAREVQGMTGFAHFFEHMMFQGSKHVGDQQHFKLIEEAGGTVNGSTGQDITHYYQTVPANELEKVLWLEADRMGFLLDAVSQKKFEIQRATVKNERAQRMDNQPYGRVSEVNGESLYPREHPYSWDTIGYVDDLNRVDVNDLKRFFLRWYGPNNATLTIGGDFKPAQALAWAERYFAPIPAGPEVSKPAPQPVTLPADRYVTLEDAIQQPALLITIPTHVTGGSQDEAALDVLAQVLAGSKNALFYQELVKPGLAVQANASFDCRELDCTLSLTVLPNVSKVQSLKPLADKVTAILDRFALRGVQPEDLARIKGGLHAQAVWRLESVEEKVNALAYGQVMEADPNASLHFLQRLEAVSADQVMTAYRQHIADRHKVLLSVVPKGETRWAVATPNYVPEPRTLAPHQTVTEPALRTVKDSFDRSRMPTSGPALTMPVPDVWRQKLDSQIEVLGSVNREIPAVSLTITLPGGRRVESASQAGLANLTALMVRQGTKRLTGEQLSDELERLGSGIRISAGMYNTAITISSLTENLPQTLALVQELLSSPGFRDSDFIRLKNQLIQARQQSEREPDTLADNAFNRLIYGPSSPLSEPDDGFISTLKGLTLADVRHYYDQYYHTAGGIVVVVGDIAQAELIPQLAFLTQREGKATSLPSLKPTEPEAKPGIYLVDVPHAVQSTLRVGRRALPYDATGDYFRAQLMNFSLGGNFNSRINLMLREEKGYTYGANSSFNGYRDVGEFVVSSDVRADATTDALRQLFKISDAYRTSGPSSEELAYLKSAFSRQDALSYETLGQKADFLLSLATLKQQPDYILRQQQLVQRVTSHQLQQQAARWLDPSKMVVVVVGDAQHLEKSLAGLHLPIYRYSSKQAAGI